MSDTALPVLPQAFFLPAQAGARAGGERFCLFHPARGKAARGSVLFLPPFAEELNNSRRVVALQAQRLANDGFNVLQIDLYGCGDSAGAFEDAQWADWLADALRAQHWLEQRASGPLWLWGLRSGALLASALAGLPRAPQAQALHLLLWQPVTSGEQLLQQFLRLHSAAQWLGKDARTGDTPAQRLTRGETVDIAGYTIRPALAEGLTGARLLVPASTPSGRLAWLEVSSQPAPAVSPAAERHLAAWRGAGWGVSAAAVTGPAFWQQVGSHALPALMDATQRALVLDQAG